MFIVANTDFGAVHKVDTGTFSEADNVQKKHHRNKHFVFNDYETAIGQLFGKFGAKVYADVEQVKMFEVLKTSKVVKYQNSADFAVGHFMFAVTRFLAAKSGNFL